MASTLLPISLQHSLQDIIEQSNLRCASIRAILLSTTEGVPLGRVVAQHMELNEDVLALIESVWAPASKQFPVLGLEKVKQVTAIYNHGTLIHIYQPPMIITIICGDHSSIGAVRSTAIPSLKIALEPMSQELVNSLQPPNIDANNSLPLISPY